MTEDEAIAELERQFVSDAGFLAQLSVQGTLDEGGVAQVRLALAALIQHWADSASVPKRAVFALAHLDLLERLIGQLHELNLYRLYTDLEEQSERCLTPGEWAVAEWWIGHEGPKRTLIEEFLSEDGFLMRLHGGQGIEQESAERIRAAIQGIQVESHEWQQVPKALGYVLVMAADVIRGCWGIYWHRPSVQQELLALADEIGLRIRACLRDEPDHTIGQMKMDPAE